MKFKKSQNLSGTKIEVTLEESKVLQEFLFLNGYKWRSLFNDEYDTEVKNLDYRYIYIHDKVITVGNSRLKFVEHSYEEINFSDLIEDESSDRISMAFNPDTMLVEHLKVVLGDRLLSYVEKDGYVLSATVKPIGQVKDESFGVEIDITVKIDNFSSYDEMLRSGESDLKSYVSSYMQEEFAGALDDDFEIKEVRIK